MEKKICAITQKEFEVSHLVSGSGVRPQIFSLIQKDHPGFSSDKFISLDKLNEYRKRYLEQILKDETGELDHIDTEVIDAIQNDTLLSENIEPEIETKLTLGARMADKIATFGGSWTFICIFFSFLLIWMGINIFILAQKPFDPYPFILLNLILSCLAAIQAPIIMMSQNRKELKDRARSENDYRVNLKAELEIRLLHEKIDHLIVHQNKRMLEIQELQIDYLAQIAKSKDDLSS